MSKREKLIEKIKNNLTNVRFEVLQNLLLNLGLEENLPNTGSSHFPSIIKEWLPWEKRKI